MSNRDETDGGVVDTHERAASAFVDRARSRVGDDIAELYVFGSTVRGETRGLASDVDVLVVLGGDNFDRAVEELRDIAYDVMLEYGPVVELHLLTEREFERSLAENQPFVRNVTREGRSYA